MLTLDPQMTMIAALTTGVGYLMIQSGLAKSALELKRRRRTCPSCGRHTDTCGC
jgi:hypothetical protein